jgi:hypothetical protein
MPPNKGDAADRQKRSTNYFRNLCALYPAADRRCWAAQVVVGQSAAAVRWWC